MNLKRKVGPLPLYGWVLLAGGGLGLVLLLKHKAGTAKGEPEAIPGSIAGPVPGESGGAGTGGGFGEEAKLPLEPATPQPVSSAVYERGGFAGEVNDVAEGASALEALGLVVPAGGATSSSAPSVAAARTKATGGSPRAGLPFKAATYHGHTAHEYAHAVPGGVGPGHRFVILPVGKKNHAAKHNHAPAHAQDHHPAHVPASHHAPAKHPAPAKAKPHKKPARHAAKPHRAKARARRR